jgi:uncharacterized membrane protein YeaQ/YmgE (transglycosylase-associated protein family)
VLIIAIILVGMLAGAAAQLIFRSRKRPIDWTAAIVVGLIGSFVGGLLVSLLAGDGIELRPSGLLGSIIGAIVVAGVYKLATGRAPGDRVRR